MNAAGMFHVSNFVIWISTI